MDKIRSALIDDFGIGYVKFGHSELMGRVVGLLICESEPISIDEICSALDVTKTPVNQICRRLEDRNLIRRVRVGGQRKYFYQIAQEVFLQAGINLSRLYEDNVQIADTHLQVLLGKYKSAADEEKRALKVVCERMIRMREFHIRLLQTYQRFISEWQAGKAGLPTVEDYAEGVGISAA